jgi:hypothetical protein
MVKKRQTCMHSYEHLVKMNEGGKEKDGVEGEVC